MSGDDGAGELRVTVEVDYGQWYLFDPDTMMEDITGLVLDPVAAAEAWERKCATNGGAAVVYTNKQSGPSEVVVRSDAAAPDLDDAADHVVECSVTTSSGRLAVSGWESTDVMGEIGVPRGPLRVRISWYGLVPDAGYDDWQRERFEVVVFPGATAPVEVLRWRSEWVPPPSESTTTEGLRRYTGPREAAARVSMEPMNRAFWSPYPVTADVSVTGLWRDPGDGSKWAQGTGPGGSVLVELSPGEYERLYAEGFPQIATYARDREGRIWSSDVMPLERVPALLYVRASRWEWLQQALGPDRMQIVDLPDGWSRITRRAVDGSGGPELVDAVENDGADGFYQRWPDGTEIPP